MSDQSYQHCTEIGKKNPYAEFDEYVMFNGNIYKWSGGGQFGRAYHSIQPIYMNGKHNHLLLKIMPYYNDDPYDQEHFDNELLVQSRAAKHGLGPTIYESGKEIPIHSPESPLQFPINSPYCQYHKFNYLLMDYYDVSPEGGWEQLKAYQLANNKHSPYICNLIIRLIKIAHISIPTDAASHFFYHPIHGYRMIDYGGSYPIETIDKDKHLADLQNNNIYGCYKLIKQFETPYGQATKVAERRRSTRLLTNPYQKGKGYHQTRYKCKKKHTHKKKYTRKKKH